MITKEMTYKEVTDEMISYVERKRDSFGMQLKAMEVDSHQQVGYWGGGGYGEEREECGQDHGEMYSFQKGQKGKGKGKNWNNMWTKGRGWNDQGGEWKVKG